MGVFLALGARICLFKPLLSGLFRLVSPGVETAQPHIHIHSLPIDLIGLFVDAVAGTKDVMREGCLEHFSRLIQRHKVMASQPMHLIATLSSPAEMPSSLV